MADTQARWGTDLRLLGDLTRQKSRDRGADLATRTSSSTGLVDLDTVSGVDNLKQALLLRFLTPVGELAALGHPTYGCRLTELIGERNTQRNRNRAKLFVLQALAQEPRVKKVLAVNVTPHRADPTRIDIDIHLTPIDSDEPLNLVFPFFLEGGATP